MWILLDDERSLPKSKIDVICKEPDSFLDILMVKHGGGEISLNPIIEGVILDYELGCEKPPKVEGTKYRQKRECTGYDVLMFMHLKGLMPPVIMLCSRNSVGRKNMHNLLINEAKYITRGGRYIRPDVITWKPEYRTDEPDTVS